MDKIYEKVITELGVRIIEEQEKRDAVSYSGNFVEKSLLEDLFRFWLETCLYNNGFVNLEREAIYPGQPAGRGRKSACDLIAEYNGKEQWIEIKVAYWNTGYTRSELITDVEKLIRLPNEIYKYYITVFISDTDNVPDRLQMVINDAEPYTVDSCNSKVGIPSPKDWQTPNTHLMINVIQVNLT